MFERVFPKQADNDYKGHWLALWILVALIALKLVVSVNSVVNTESVAVGADGFRLDGYGADGARAVLMLFALSALAQLTLAVVGLTVMLRYRSLVPFIYLLSLVEMLGRRLLVSQYAVVRDDAGSFGWYMNAGVVAALMLGLALSLSGPKKAV